MLTFHFKLLYKNCVHRFFLGKKDSTMSGGCQAAQKTLLRTPAMLNVAHDSDHMVIFVSWSKSLTIVEFGDVSFQITSSWHNFSKDDKISVIDELDKYGFGPRLGPAVHVEPKTKIKLMLLSTFSTSIERGCVTGCDLQFRKFYTKSSSRTIENLGQGHQK